MHRPALNSLGVILSASILANSADAQPEHQHETVLEDSWQVVFVQGQRVGYAHSVTWETGAGAGAGAGDDKHIWSESLTQMSIARFGGKLTMTVTQVTEEDDAGNLLSFTLDTNNPPISHSIVTGTVRGDQLHLTTTAAGKTTQSTQPWDADVKSPVYQDRLLHEDPVVAGETRTLRVFDPQFLKAGNVTLTGLEPQETELLDGARRRLERTQIVHSLVPGLKMTAFQDEQGETLKTETNLLSMVTYTVSREEAVKEIAGPQLDLALSTIVVVEPISRAHQRKRIVYELSVERPHIMDALPEGDTQSVTAVDDQTVRVTVTSAKVAADEPSAQKEQSVDGAYRGPSRYLECQHPQVAAHAKAAAGTLQAPAQIALAMEKYVHEKLVEKNFSTALATAAEVASNLEGDCTEHAMLLAALLRVKDIPSRVAVGMVYSERHSAFVGHMWTEAFLDGRWIPLDATLAQGGIGAAHLKFSDSSLSDDGPAPVTVFVPLVGLVNKLQIKVIDAGAD
ncbi:MAG: transglutaminase family protein [Planctomycetaceae bacterium]